MKSRVSDWRWVLFLDYHVKLERGRSHGKSGVPAEYVARALTTYPTYRNKTYHVHVVGTQKMLLSEGKHCLWRLIGIHTERTGCSGSVPEDFVTEDRLCHCVRKEAI